MHGVAWVHRPHGPRAGRHSPRWPPDADGLACRARPQTPQVPRSPAVEGDEAAVGAGHPGPPEVGQHTGRTGRRTRRTGQGGRGPVATERPAVLGRRPPGGQSVITLRAHVQHKTRAPFMPATRAPGPLVDPDDYRLDARLCAWGEDHPHGHHGRGEDASDADGDGVCAVQGHRMAGVGSLWRSWLRPPRGIAPAQLPLSRGCFASVPQARQRGKALRHALLE